MIVSSNFSVNCEVCDLPTETKHFDAYCCKACAAFFRRTVAQQKSYKCRGDGKCVIKGSKFCSSKIFE